MWEERSLKSGSSLSLSVPQFQLGHTKPRDGSLAPPGQARFRFPLMDPGVGRAS
jgi:hypothetical protein